MRRKSPAPSAGTDKVLLNQPPAAAAALPYGVSIFSAVAAADPAPASRRALYPWLAGAGLLALPGLPTALVAGGVDGSWDAAHGVGWGSLSGLMRESMGVSDAEAANVGWFSAAAFGLLFALDALSEFSPAIRWPASWHCENTVCYLEMFSEPTRSTCWWWCSWCCSWCS